MLCQQVSTNRFHLIQIAKINQNSSKIFIYTVVQYLMQKCKKIKSKLWSRQCCGTVEKFIITDYMFKQLFKHNATSFKIQTSFMQYHSIGLVDRICLQRIVVGQHGHFYLSVDTVPTPAAFYKRC